MIRPVRFLKWMVGRMKDDDYRLQRFRMVEDQLKKRGIKSGRVLDAMERVPREKFVPEHIRFRAYDDCPLSIGQGQTISQPYMVALMTEALALEGTERVLEVGTGSGYQSAVLAECAREVVTIERIGALLKQARETLDGLGCTGITFVEGDGSKGCPDMAPYEGIIVTAGAPSVPESLKDQLTDGGRLVIPVGDQSFQSCLLVTREGRRFPERNLTACTFVPLVGEEGW